MLRCANAVTKRGMLWSAVQNWMELRRGLRLNDIAEAAEETQRSIDDIVFALLLLHGGLGLLNPAPEYGMIARVENKQADLHHLIAGGDRVATSIAAADACAGIVNRSV